MTLRDYFAAKAMVAIIGTSAAPFWFPETSGDDAIVSAHAYKIADAMIAERNK